MPTFNIALPDYGPSKSTKTRTLSVSFGDGYKQSVPDGINSVVETWSLNFTSRTKAEITAIDNFLSGLKGCTPFDWVTPQGVSKRFRCEEWAPSYNWDGDCSLSCAFIQHFGT